MSIISWSINYFWWYCRWWHFAVNIDCAFETILANLDYLDLSFILALSVKCGKVRDSWIIKASKAFIITVKVSKRKASQWHREIYFTFKSALIFQIFTSFYILVIIIVTIIADGSVIRTMQKIPQKLAWKLTLISRAHQTTKNYNGLLNLMKVQYPRKIYNKTGWGKFYWGSYKKSS